MAFCRRRSTFRSSTGSLGWISWNRSCKDGTLGLGRCLRPLRGFHILGRTALETLPKSLVEKHVPEHSLKGFRVGCRLRGQVSSGGGSLLYKKANRLFRVI